MWGFLSLKSVSSDIQIVEIHCWTPYVDVLQVFHYSAKPRSQALSPEKEREPGNIWGGEAVDFHYLIMLSIGNAMQQNCLIYNRQISDSQKLIIRCQSLEIEFTFTEIDAQKSIFTNRSSEIDL